MLSRKMGSAPCPKLADLNATAPAIKTLVFSAVFHIRNVFSAVFHIKNVRETNSHFGNRQAWCEQTDACSQKMECRQTNRQTERQIDK